MVLLVDNYDSFTYNLYHLAGSVNPDIKVIRNDQMTVEDVEGLNPDQIILSPGPGRPENAGICIDLIKKFAGKIPIMGVCLGHQAIVQAFGGKITYAAELMHGRKKPIKRIGKSKILEGLPEKFSAARYHSLEADKAALPTCLRITAVSDDEREEIMAVEHEKYPVFGVQFHPESVMTEVGKQIMENFFRM
ncbi:MAG: aminodeoxychorismate/anthranilate synthase component II [Lachnospiraceae bacterium]|uniref:Aminodeoxychorismate/anthranilate synthase component II n=1 Tax=Candidatus Weimeria bifida TaxID=2599074 RepID=A0A6N7J304_9FIRM|nr:aminodeoxychorismate/anthranilate synthase component II [Candidatus Weimeria bifida]RRF96897.1 MAG: aminodeoxychorismate/anthranilate synthase component II [Lachnospiraceae bacterium]